MHDALYPLLRLGLYVDLLLLVGLSTWLAFAPAKTRSLFRQALSGRLIGWLAVVGLVVAAAAMLVAVAGMMGQSLDELEAGSIKAIVVETAAGRAFVVRMAFLGLAILACFLPLSELARLRMSGLSSVAALCSLAWSGHAAATEGSLGTLHRFSDALHLLAVAVWIGAIFGFVTLAGKQVRFRQPDQLAELAKALRRFAPFGTLLVLVIAATGAVNVLLVVGWQALPELLPDQYGVLLLAKLVLFAGMLAAAGLHRWLLAPRLHAVIERWDNHEASLRMLRLSLAIEFLFAVMILGVVAWLGLSMPPET